MIVKSYEVEKKVSNLLTHNLFLFYGENFGLKKDLKEFIKNKLKEKDKSVEILSVYEKEVLDNDENFFNSVYSGSLFSAKKIITIYDGTDKIIEKINKVYDKYPENVFLIIFSEVLEKKSKLRNFFESHEKTICVPCYLDSEKDLEIIAHTEFKKNNISISREAVNLLIEKSNSDRNNLRNEIEKVISYSFKRKKIELDEIKSLVNFSGDYKSDNLVNECLCGNIAQYKKVMSELYVNTTNQLILLRILSNKIHRLIKIKEQGDGSNNVDNLINNSKPSIFWKEKPLVKKQLSIWGFNDLKKTINDINNTELSCKKNPQISKFIFINFFSALCKKASSYS